MSFLKNIIKQNPYQSFLMVWNIGIFSFLKTISSSLFGNIDISKVPTFITGMTGIEADSISRFLQTSPYRWLIISILMTLIYRMVGGVIRFLFNIILLGGGLYLLILYLQTKGINVIGLVSNFLGGIN